MTGQDASKYDDKAAAYAGGIRYVLIVELDWLCRHAILSSQPPRTSVELSLYEHVKAFLLSFDNRAAREKWAPFLRQVGTAAALGGLHSTSARGGEARGAKQLPNGA